MYLLNTTNIYLNNVLETGEVMLKKYNLQVLRAHLDPSDRFQL